MTSKFLRRRHKLTQPEPIPLLEAAAKVLNGAQFESLRRAFHLCAVVVLAHVRCFPVSLHAWVGSAPRDSSGGGSGGGGGGGGGGRGGFGGFGGGGDSRKALAVASRAWLVEVPRAGAEDGAEDGAGAGGGASGGGGSGGALSSTSSAISGSSLL